MGILFTTDDFVGDINSLGLTTFASTFTISTWFYTNNINNSSEIFSMGNNANNNPLLIVGVSNSVGAGGVRYVARDTGGSIENNTTAGGLIAAGAWHNLVYVNRGAADRELYLDGVSVATDDNTSLGAVALGQWTIGALRQIANSEFFDGQIDEVAAWNIDLSVKEIVQLAIPRKRTPFKIQPNNRIAYWSMDDNPDGTSADGDTIKDLFGNGNDGVGDNGANNTGLIWKAEEVLNYRNKMYFGEALTFAALESNRIKYGNRTFDITYIDNPNEEDVYKRYFLTERR